MKVPFQGIAVRNGTNFEKLRFFKKVIENLLKIKIYSVSIMTRDRLLVIDGTVVSCYIIKFLLSAR